MAGVTVYEPVPDRAQQAQLRYASRGEYPSKLRLTLVDNSKPRAKDVLEQLADELRGSLPIDTIDLFSKAHAGRPLTADEARVIAARSHLVITGVGD